MKAFPMFIRTTDRKVVVVGGGEQAAQKMRLLLKTDAQLVVVSPELDDELQALVDDGRVAQLTSLSPEVFDDAAMAFVGTGCPGLDAAVHGLAKAARCPVNVVDQPALCDMTTPAIVDRDPIVVAIGSEGTAPVLTRETKTKIEQILPQRLGALAALAGRLRPSVDRSVPRAQRRALWAWVFKGAPRADWVRGQERQAASAIKSAIAAGGPPSEQAAGHISLVGAGPGARDLLTLRAIERLQEADVIFYDRLVDPAVLELARRDAERVFVGKQVGAHAWPQGQINQLIISAAKKGQRVVRLKSGDPGIFGRAGEELKAAKAAGISVDIVPGVTAAAAASAAMGASMTERGIADTVVLTTASGCDDNPLPDCARMISPGTTIAFYMAMGNASRVSRALLDRGVPSDAPVTVAVRASWSDEQISDTTVENLPTLVAENGLSGSAVILFTWPDNRGHVADGTQKPPVCAQWGRRKSSAAVLRGILTLCDVSATQGAMGCCSMR